MEYILKIGGIGFRISSHFEIKVEESFAQFISPNSNEYDINIEVSRDFQQAPRPAAAILGKDLILEYYRQHEELLCVAREGGKGTLAVTQCDSTFSHLVCYMNTEEFTPKDSLGGLLRMLPMRSILQYHGAQFFHASQIAVGNMGILFTAPSGTGKTTQAKLWRDLRGARIVCNDRTLIRDGKTYGYPMDGSEPVCSGEIYPLGAVVFLRQSPVNRVQRLKPSAVLAKLMPQLVFDTWDPEARAKAAAQLLDLMAHYPVYQLDCTPDEAAVMCLEHCLKKDGVMK